MSIQEAEYLIRLARQSIQSFLQTNTAPQLPKDPPGRLLEKAGVFVTLSKASADGALRGCIGSPYPEQPLVRATMRSAIAAATEDHRFEPVKTTELEKDIVIEISVLSVPEILNGRSPRDYLDMITVGRNGLIVERGSARGLLLPQVAAEWNWDVEDFLANACFKAGLPPDAWLLKGTKIKVFDAQVFAETTPGGEVVAKNLSRVGGN